MKLLIADDDAVTRRILERMVRQLGFEPILACDGLEAWQILCGDDPPCLVLLDWMMPGMDGVEICRKLRASPQGAFVRVIMLTVRNETTDLVEALNAGADNFIAKPFKKEELQVRLRAGQRIAELEASLRYEASHDRLTGAFNRAAILEILDRELARARRAENNTALLMLDLDRFKSVNDTFGHQTGDRVLQEVARRISTVIRSFDALGRYGGEEFLIVLPDCDVAAASIVAERIRADIRAQPVNVNGCTVPVTVSIGGSTSMSGSQPGHALIQEADAALYHAKKNGRDRVDFALAITGGVPVGG